MMYDIFKIASLLFFIIIFGEYSKVIGGFLWAILALILRIPLIGKLYHFLLFGKVKFSILIKATTWAIGASGILMGIFFYFLLFEPTGYPIENWIIFISSIAVIVNFFYSTMYLDILDYGDIHAFGKKYVRKIMGDDAANMMEDEEVKTKLLYSNVIDTEVIRFLQYLVCIGVFYYSANQLGFFNIKPNASVNPDLWLCIRYAFAFVPIEKVNNVDVIFEGSTWDAVNIFLGMGVFLWTFIFFGAVVDSLSQYRNSDKDSNSNIEKKFDNLDNILGNVFNHFHGMLDNILTKIKEIEESQPVKRQPQRSKKAKNSDENKPNKE